MADLKRIEAAVTEILLAIGEDPQREGLAETPSRVAKMYAEVFAGMREEAEEHLSKVFSVKSTDCVIEKDIVFYSMCEHHLLPFFGRVAVAYLPEEKVAGLSKLARTVEVFARRPQLQERMTNQIADAMADCLDARGVLVLVEAEHTCMTMRGVKKPGSKTITLAKRGAFATDAQLVAQTLELMK